jgi:hypothetical protein
VKTTAFFAFFRVGSKQARLKSDSLLDRVAERFGSGKLRLGMPRTGSK